MTRVSLVGCNDPASQVYICAV